MLPPMRRACSELPHNSPLTLSSEQATELVEIVPCRSTPSDGSFDTGAIAKSDGLVNLYDLALDEQRLRTRVAALHHSTAWRLALLLIVSCVGCRATICDYSSESSLGCRGKPVAKPML